MKNKPVLSSLLVLLLIAGCDRTEPAATVTLTPTTIVPVVTSTLEVSLETMDVPISPDNAADVKLLRRVEEGLGRVWTLAFSADGKYFAYTNKNGLNVQDTANSQPVFPLRVAMFKQHSCFMVKKFWLKCQQIHPSGADFS